MQELLCASVCVPTMMSIQVQCFGWDMRREKVHDQNHTLGARGNMTAFQLPWQRVFNELNKLKEVGPDQALHMVYCISYTGIV